MSRSTWATAALPALLLVAASVLADSPSGLTNSNEHVVWKKGDLAPPLPHDPAARAAAVAQAERNGQRVVAVDARTVTYAAPEERVVVQARPVVRPAGGALPTAPDPAMARWLGDLRSRLRAPGAASNQNGDVPTQVNDPNHRIITTQNESTTLTPTLITSFDGIDDTGLDPGAPDIAAGPDHLVLATTDRITIMDKCGNTLYSDLLRVFAGAPSTAAYYTPRVIYDEWDNRWILVFIGTETNYSNSTVYVMYSTTPDPTGPWTGYALGTAVFAGLKDYPGVAVTPDGVYLTWDRYNLTTFSFESAIIAEIGKTDFYNDGGTTIYTKSLMTNPHDASLAFSIRPAQMHTYGGTMYFVNDVVFGANFLTLWKLTGLPGASVLTGYDVVIGAYTPPSDVMQLDGTLVDTGDCRVLDAVYSAGTLYETHDEQVSASPSVTVSSIDVTSLGHYKISLQPPNNYANAYGAIDVDDNGQVAVVYSAWGGGALNPSLYYRFLQLPPGSNVGGGLLIYGTDSFHSTAQPYRWGPYAGAARDPSDGRKVWIYGMYASNSPANSWATRVGAVTTFAPSNLTVNATASFYYAGGFVGGPFTPTVFPYDLENTGQTTADWTLTNIPSWLTASASSGHLAPGEIQTISLALSPAADALPAGSYWTYLNFQNCTGTGSVSRYISLGIGTDGSCPGAFVPLYPKSATPTLSSSLSGPGMYLTAIEDVHVCAVDVTANLVEAPQLVYARVYEANGNTRGSLVAENSYDLVQPGNVTHAIPLDVTLQACHEYEVSVEFTGAATYDTYNELGLNLPRDIGGVIRLRNASENGSPSSAEAAQI
ncbi:MAG TPA: hypothetical protein VFH88_03810, partial [Candidatus Krumholzibacteria bacterium]|nr:hypothetical protein [Candidatus Krumholzibacteria bacterium]